MCLYSTTGKKIAERDIVCYKVLSYWHGKYYTPVMGKKVKDAVLTGRRLFRGGLFRQKRKFTNYISIEGGYVHVYSTLMNCHRYWFCGGCRYYKCIIPKGTEYWVNDDGKEFAARKIRFVERVVLEEASPHQTHRISSYKSRRFLIQFT
jgi:hypothetical protein